MDWSLLIRLFGYYEKVGALMKISCTLSSAKWLLLIDENRSLIEAACTMLIYCNMLLYFNEAEAVATRLLYQNRSHDTLSSAPEHAVLTGLPSSTTVDQDAPSPSSAYRKALKCGKKDLLVSKGAIHRGLWYLKDSSIALTAFADADHAGC
ncbi:hypothetical protein Tco_0143709 [Tanacetum coccineum]|uniref:Uncharacterized protein n=1 Tax=Tanacetum coccineum TaxID=301880 RepID=A0ABQ5D9M5_9ASTR